LGRRHSGKRVAWSGAFMMAVAVLQASDGLAPMPGSLILTTATSSLLRRVERIVVISGAPTARCSYPGTVTRAPAL